MGQGRRINKSEKEKGPPEHRSLRHKGGSHSQIEQFFLEGVRNARQKKGVKT